MKQIAYLTMVFLPASFVAVSVPLRSHPYANGSARLTGRVRHERAGNSAQYQRHAGALRRDGAAVHATHDMGDHRLAGPVHLPDRLEFLGAPGMARPRSGEGV